MMKNALIVATKSFALLCSSLAGATVVQFQTSLGPFEVNLYDEGTPATVANFLAYVESGAYNNTVVHRSVSGFVIQGGGFVSSGGLPLGAVDTSPAVQNEPAFSNVRGTIAMAKLGGDPDSATSQWFLNLSDNSETLDPQNGGFTVFGEVVGTGMEDVVDAIAALPVFDAGGALSELPLQNYTAQNAQDSVPVTDDHLIRVTAIVVIDAATNTASALSPPENTLIVEESEPPVTLGGGGGGGGGAIGFVSLFALLTAALARVSGYARRRRSGKAAP